MQTKLNRESRRKVISQNKGKKITRELAAAHTERALLKQIEAFEQSMAIIKRVATVYFGESIPEVLLFALSTEIEKRAPTDFAQVDSIINELVTEHKTIYGG